MGVCLGNRAGLIQLFPAAVRWGDPLGAALVIPQAMIDPFRFALGFTTAILVGTIAAYFLRQGLTTEALLVVAGGGTGAYLIMGRGD